ncbi:sodium:proton antiporter [Synechococcus sp. PCC 7336]|uniref:cation:proton antiporter n=1 Tax=Synechococcus sp. PCC 7336 TaxID=195250 RepID=UPI000347DD73|nr:sodium:proton antiporter [Synechococcus sp. PCC 7336]
MEQSATLTTMMVAVLVAGIGAQVLANIVKLPSIVFLLLFGVLLGPDGWGIIRPQLLGTGIEVIVALSVALILFEGGLNLNLKTLGRVSGSLWRLVSLGATITLLGGAIASHYLGEFPWRIAFIYSSLVVVTGPTVINPILKRVRVSESLSSLLEGEGVLIDPIGAILALAVLNLAVAGDPNSKQLVFAVEQLAGSLALGGAIGAVGGWIVGQLLKKFQNFFSEELTNSVVLASALGIYALSQSLLAESGLMAAVTAGIALRQVAEIKERQVRRFQGQLVLLAVSVLFILLTANLSLKSFTVLGWGAAGTVATLMLLVRPLSILLCTLGGELTWREKVFAAWMAPRGIVAASVSSLFALVLAERQIAGGEAVKALVFLTIASTVVLQGLSAGLVAQLLDLKEGGTTVVVSNNAIGLRVAELLREGDQPVAAIAHQQTRVNTPPQRGEWENYKGKPGLTVIYGNALDASVLARAGLERADQLVAISLNGDVNQAIAELAAKTYDISRVLAALPPGQNSSAAVEDIAGGSAAIERWNTYVHREKIHLKPLQLPALSRDRPPQWAAQLVSGSAQERSRTSAIEGEFDKPSQLPTISNDNLAQLLAKLVEFASSDFLLPIALRRKEAYILFPHSQDWRPGDELFCLEREASAIAIQYKPIAPLAQPARESSSSRSAPADGMPLQPQPEA